MNDIDAYRGGIFSRVVGDFTRVSELTSIQGFQAPDHCLGWPDIGYQNVGLMIASDEKVPAAAIAVLGFACVSVKKLVAISFRVPR